MVLPRAPTDGEDADHGLSDEAAGGPVGYAECLLTRANATKKENSEIHNRDLHRLPLM